MTLAGRLGINLGSSQKPLYELLIEFQCHIRTFPEMAYYIILSFRLQFHRITKCINPFLMGMLLILFILMDFPMHIVTE